MLLPVRTVGVMGDLRTYPIGAEFVAVFEDDARLHPVAGPGHGTPLIVVDSGTAGRFG